MSDVKVKFLGLTALERKLDNPAAKAVLFKKIGAIYRSFAMERFSTFSRGGGTWKPLALSTVMSRRNNKRKKKGKAKPIRRASILIDKGLLFGALAPELSAGALEEHRRDSVRVGYGGPSRYPNGKATIADVAAFHQFGGKHLPARPIIVQPDQSTMALFERRTIEWLKTP